jgi:phospholipid N-methyltransferase
VLLTANSDNFLTEYILNHIITEMQLDFFEVENEFLYNLEEIRESINLKLTCY